MSRYNKSTANRLKKVWEKTGGICSHCGKQATGSNRTSDHYVTRSRGGTYDLRNLFPLCKDCNRARQDVPISPATYYKYASREHIRDCLQYEQEFLRSRRSMSGDTY